MVKKKHLVISVMVLIYSILIVLFVCKDSIINHDFNTIEFTDFADTATQNCLYIEDNIFQITNPDPFFIIQNINMDVKNVEVNIECEKGFAVALYYDDGSGYNEQNSICSIVRDNKVKFDLTNKVNIKNLRIDFESLSNGDLVTVNSILINNVSSIDISSVYPILVINMIALFINFFFLSKLKSKWRLVDLLYISIALVYIDFIMVKPISLYLKVILVLFFALFNFLLLKRDSEVSDLENKK